jgi:ribosomal protein S18
MLQMLADLAKRMESLRCTEGHGCKIQYVKTGKRAAKRFLCNDCLHELDTHDKKGGKVIDLKDYFYTLKEFSTNDSFKQKTNQAFVAETETALEVTKMLSSDLVESLGGIKAMIQNHYTDMMSKVTVNATKCSTLILPKIDRDLKRHLLELTSIENNLNIMQGGGNPTDICQIIDQAITYTAKKSVADNGLYHLLNGINPVEAAQSTHLRLADYGNKYLHKKKRIIQEVKTILETRFKKDEKMLRTFIDERKKILESIDGYLAESQKAASTTEAAANPETQIGVAEERLAMRNAMREFGLISRPFQGKYLGKRRSNSTDYDPKISFESKFGKEKKLSVEDQFNSLRVEGAQPVKNRLSDALKPMKPTQQSRFYGANAQTGGTPQQHRLRSKRSAGPKTANFIELDRSKLPEDELVLASSENVLRPQNTNVAAHVPEHPYAKNTVQDETLKAMSSRKTAQSYLDFLAKEKKKQAAYLQEFGSHPPTEDLKENNPALSKQDIHDKSLLLQQVMLEVPIKRLNANDPRRKTMHNVTFLGLRQAQNN